MEIKADVSHALAGITQVEKNLTLNPLLDPLTKHFDQANREQVESEGERGGEVYEPLRPSTVRDRLRKGYGGKHKILQREKDLLEGVSHGQPAGHDGGKTAVINYGDEEGHAAFNQETRPSVEPTEDDADWAANLLADQLVSNF